MPTEDENLVPIVRDINVLLSLGTYQDMTDDEIESVIQYKIANAITQHDNERDASVIEQTATAQINAYTQVANNSQSMLNYMLQMQIPWATVAPDGTVNQNV